MILVQINLSPLVWKPACLGLFVWTHYVVINIVMFILWTFASISKDVSNKNGPIRDPVTAIIKSLTITKINVELHDISGG